MDPASIPSDEVCLDGLCISPFKTIPRVTREYQGNDTWGCWIFWRQIDAGGCPSGLSRGGLPVRLATTIQNAHTWGDCGLLKAVHLPVRARTGKGKWGTRLGYVRPGGEQTHSVTDIILTQYFRNQPEHEVSMMKKMSRVYIKTGPNPAWGQASLDLILALVLIKPNNQNQGASLARTEFVSLILLKDCIEIVCILATEVFGDPLQLWIWVPCSSVWGPGPAVWAQKMTSTLGLRCLPW